MPASDERTYQPSPAQRHTGAILRDLEEDAAHLVWRLMTYLPDNCPERPSRYEARPPRTQGAVLDGLVPEEFEINDPLDLHPLFRRYSAAKR